MNRLAAIITILVGTASLQQAQALPLINGSFESPVVGGLFQTIPAGDPSLTGWTVVSGSVDAVSNTLWQPAAGVQSLDLNGTSPGQISQSFATVIGETYLLSFAYANSFAVGSASANVLVSGTGTLLNQNVNHSGSTALNMNYTSFSQSFVADSLTTILQFGSLSVGDAGIALDDVVVVLAPAAGTPEIDPGTALLPLGFMFCSMLVLSDRRALRA